MSKTPKQRRVQLHYQPYQSTSNTDVTNEFGDLPLPMDPVLSGLSSSLSRNLWDDWAENDSDTFLNTGFSGQGSTTTESTTSILLPHNTAEATKDGFEQAYQMNNFMPPPHENSNINSGNDTFESMELDAHNTIESSGDQPRLGVKRSLSEDLASILEGHHDPYNVPVDYATNMTAKRHHDFQRPSVSESVYLDSNWLNGFQPPSTTLSPGEIARIEANNQRPDPTPLQQAAAAATSAMMDIPNGCKEQDSSMKQASTPSPFNAYSYMKASETMQSMPPNPFGNHGMMYPGFMMYPMMNPMGMMNPMMGMYPNGMPMMGMPMPMGILPPQSGTPPSSAPKVEVSKPGFVQIARKPEAPEMSTILQSLMKEEAQKKEKKLERNRDSARESRKKQQTYVETLENGIKQLQFNRERIITYQWGRSLGPLAAQEWKERLGVITGLSESFQHVQNPSNFQSLMQMNRQRRSLSLLQKEKEQIIAKCFLSIGQSLATLRRYVLELSVFQYGNELQEVLQITPEQQQALIVHTRKVFQQEVLQLVKLFKVFMMIQRSARNLHIMSPSLEASFRQVCSLEQLQKLLQWTETQRPMIESDLLTKRKEK